MVIDFYGCHDKGQVDLYTNHGKILIVDYHN